MFLSEDTFALSPVSFEKASIVETGITIKEDAIRVPDDLKSPFDASISVEKDVLTFTRLVLGYGQYSSLKYETLFKRNNYTVKFRGDEDAYAEILYFLSVGTWKDETFERELTAAVVHPLRNVGPCVIVETAMQDEVITNWPSPVVRVQKLEYLELRSVNRLLCKCASILVRGDMYIVEAPNDIEVDL